MSGRSWSGSEPEPRALSAARARAALRGVAAAPMITSVAFLHARPRRPRSRCRRSVRARTRNRFRLASSPRAPRRGPLVTPPARAAPAAAPSLRTSRAARRVSTSAMRARDSARRRSTCRRRSAWSSADTSPDLRARVGHDRFDSRALLGRERELFLETLEKSLAFALALAFSSPTPPRRLGARLHRRRRHVGSRRPGRKRSAAFGTLSTFSRVSTMMRTLAVMPGKRPRSGLDVRDHRDIGDDVLDDLRRLAHLLDRAAESAARERVDGEGRLLADADAADFGFVDRGLDLHLRAGPGRSRKARAPAGSPRRSAPARPIS